MILATLLLLFQQVREPVPRPQGAYLLHVTAQQPALRGMVSASTPAGPGLYDIVAYVAPQQRGPFDLAERGLQGPGGTYIHRELLDQPIYLEISDGASLQRIPLSGPGLDIVNHGLEVVRGRNLNLGKFGNAQLWATIQAGSYQTDFVLNWHTGRWGVRAVGDVFFQAARLIVPDGMAWHMNLTDSVADAEHLVKPGQYTFPQQAERSFRFSVYPRGSTYRVPWSTRGVSTAPVPVWGTAPYCPPTQLDATTARASLEGLQPVDGNQPPTSALWPAWGVHYGGMTSGVDMHPMYGVRWMATAQTAGVELAMIEQLRYRSRHWGCLVESSGHPVKPELLPTESTWEMYNSVLMRSGPFQFPPRRIQPNTGPEVFAPIDCQHLVREQNHNWMLAYAGDYLARHYLEMEAAKSVLTFWPGTGRARRWPNMTPGGGTTLGRDTAWAAITIAHALAYGAPPARYQGFVREYVDGLERGQMVSGLFQINPGAKESKKQPFAPNAVGDADGTPAYLIGSGNEECYHVAGLYALRAFDPRIVPILTRHAIGLERLAWALGSNGVWSHSARGPIGTGTRYTTRADWPASLTVGMASGCITCPYQDGYHTGYAIACYQKLGIPLGNLRNWWTGGSDPRTWGLSRNGVPIEQWWMAVQQP